MGAAPLQVFWHWSHPAGAAGAAQRAAARVRPALGEFGATVMVFGLREGRLTLPTKVYFDYEQGDAARAIPAVVALGLLSFLLIFLYNRSSAGQRD